MWGMLSLVARRLVKLSVWWFTSRYRNLCVILLGCIHNSPVKLRPGTSSSEATHSASTEVVVVVFDWWWGGGKVELVGCYGAGGRRVSLHVLLFMYKHPDGHDTCVLHNE